VSNEPDVAMTRKARSPAEIKNSVREAAGLGTAENGSDRAEATHAEVEQDLNADELDPSRVAPSAEGEVTFGGLTDEVRVWLEEEIARVSRNGNGHGPPS